MADKRRRNAELKTTKTAFKKIFERCVVCSQSLQLSRGRRCLNTSHDIRDDLYTLLHINPDLSRLFGDGVQIPHAQAAHTAFYVCAACGSSLIKVRPRRLSDKLTSLQAEIDNKRLQISTSSAIFKSNFLVSDTRTTRHSARPQRPDPVIDQSQLVERFQNGTGNWVVLIGQLFSLVFGGWSAQTCSAEIERVSRTA